MNKDTTNRKEFVKKAVENPVAAAVDLRAMADKLEGSANTTQVVKTLSEGLYLSERTIFGDYCQGGE